MEHQEWAIKIEERLNEMRECNTKTNINVINDQRVVDFFTQYWIKFQDNKLIIGQKSIDMTNMIVYVAIDESKKGAFGQNREGKKDFRTTVSGRPPSEEVSCIKVFYYPKSNESKTIPNKLDCISLLSKGADVLSKRIITTESNDIEIERSKYWKHISLFENTRKRIKEEEATMQKSVKEWKKEITKTMSDTTSLPSYCRFIKHGNWPEVLIKKDWQIYKFLEEIQKRLHWNEDNYEIVATTTDFRQQNAGSLNHTQDFKPRYHIAIVLKWEENKDIESKLKRPELNSRAPIVPYEIIAQISPKDDTINREEYWSKKQPIS